MLTDGRTDDGRKVITTAHPNKYKQDDGHLRFPIRTILTTVDLQVTSILSI